VQGAESYGYGHPHYHTQTSSSYDPWTTTSTSTSTTGWYSPYQQYSPPKIAYKGGSSKVTEFAICQVIASAAAQINITANGYTPAAATNIAGLGNPDSTAGTAGTSSSILFVEGTSRLRTQLQFAQAPGKTTSMNIKDFAAEGVHGSTAGTPEDTTALTVTVKYEFRLMEYGQLLKNSTATTGTLLAQNCGNMGNQFRPLKEVDKYGRVNPFQDPNRGIIPLQSASTQSKKVANITGTNYGQITANTKVRNLLISLSGKDSIIGRGIQVWNKTPKSSTDATIKGKFPVGCCVVALDVPPTVSVNHHHHYGYGGYGHGHGYSAPSYSRPSYSAPSHGHGYGGHGYTTAANTSNSTHKHDYGHGNGIGSHSHSGHGSSGYGGYSTGSHTHGTTTHTHEVGAPKVTATKSNDFFGGSKSGSSYFSNMAYQPSSRYTSRRY
jgi:hypothetical protein